MPPAKGGWIKLPCPCCPGSGSGADSGGGPPFPGEMVSTGHCPPLQLRRTLHWTVIQVCEPFQTTNPAAPRYCCTPRFDGSGVSVAVYVAGQDCWEWPYSVNVGPDCFLGGNLLCGCCVPGATVWKLPSSYNCGSLLQPFICGTSQYNAAVILEAFTPDPFYVEFLILDCWRVIFTE